MMPPILPSSANHRENVGRVYGVVRLFSRAWGAERSEIYWGSVGKGALFDIFQFLARDGAGMNISHRRFGPSRTHLQVKT